MDFLLECIGFPPEFDHEALCALVRERGEPVAWRGPAGEHLRLPLAHDLELRLDREQGRPHASLMPYFAEPGRLRVLVTSVRRVPDSPFDALLAGWAAPPVPGEGHVYDAPGAYPLVSWITDARRLPDELMTGRVLAIRHAGFALDVSYVGPNAGGADASVVERRRGAHIRPLGGEDDPGGCAEVSARVRELRHVRNPVTGIPVDVLEVDAPERPLRLFLSPWQLEKDGLPAPRPGWRVEGVFYFVGRIAGGLPGPARRVRRSFG